MSNLHVSFKTPSLFPSRIFIIAIALVCLLVLLVFGFSRAAEPGYVTIQEISGTNRASDEIATALDSNNNQWVVWKDSPTGWYYQIWYSTRNGNNGWAGAKSLEISTYNSYKPAITITPDNTKFIAWEKFDGAHRIAYVQFTDVPGEPLFLPGIGTADYEPVLASSADGTRHMAFSRGGTIYHAQTTDGLNWSFDPLSIPSTFLFYPSMAIDNSTHLISVAYWSSVGNTIYFAQRDISGGAWKNLTILGTGKDVDVSARDGKVAVSWTEGSNHQPAVRILQNGSWSDIQHPSLYNGGYHTHIVLDSAGNPHMVWMQNVYNANYDIFSADFVQGQWTMPQDLKPSPGLDEGNDLVIDPSDGLHAVFLEFATHKSAFSADWRAGDLPALLPTSPPSVPTPTTMLESRTFDDTNKQVTAHP